MSIRIEGKPGAAGVAVGPVWRYVPGGVGEPRRVASAASSAPAAEDSGSAVRAAAASAAEQLTALARSVRKAGRGDEAGMFEAQAMMATDPEVLDAAVARVEVGEEPVSAVRAAAASAAAAIAALPDELLAGRAADVRDVGERIARILLGEEVALPEVPSIAIADDLPPSVAAEVPPGLLLGLALEGGSATAHAVILARSFGIPAVVAAKGLMSGGAAASAAWVAIDGSTGEVVLDPDPGVAAEFRARAAALAESGRTAAGLRGRPCATADGERVALLANIGSPADAPRALEAGAEGVGLFRTEFLFMRRRTAPTESEQVAAYRAVFEAFGPDRPVVVRLADIGGDKTLPYVNALVTRQAGAGSRELLLTQLRAVWRAAALARVTPHVMAPMVVSLADAQLLLELRDEARGEAAVKASVAGDPLPEKMVTGVMVETPSAAMLAPELARMVDFFSIGTNDLAQYAMAADRGNPELAHLQDALHPAVLQLIRAAVAGADEAGIPVAVCGELAGDPVGALVLVGLGVDELSADAGSLDGVRAALAAVTRAQLSKLAVRALAATDAQEVRAMAAELPGRATSSAPR
jgi:phosphoenolpyruvate-protein phosphotransferase